MSQPEPRRFPVPDDPSGIDAPHDVLAADEFGIGTRYDRLPPDPSGIEQPHDVLAAEEFAMPAGVEPHDEGRRLPEPRTLIPLVLIVAIGVLAVLRRRN